LARLALKKLFVPTSAVLAQVGKETAGGTAGIMSRQGRDRLMASVWFVTPSSTTAGDGPRGLVGWGSVCPGLASSAEPSPTLAGVRCCSPVPGTSPSRWPEIAGTCRGHSESTAGLVPSFYFRAIARRGAQEGKQKFSCAQAVTRSRSGVEKRARGARFWCPNTGVFCAFLAGGVCCFCLLYYCAIGREVKGFAYNPRT